MLSRSERTILEEVIGELGNIRQRLYKQYWNMLDPNIDTMKEVATADRAVGSVIHSLLNVAISTIERVIHFDGQAELGLQMVETLKRILYGDNRVSEWEALIHTPEYARDPNPKAGPPEWRKYVGVDYGKPQGTVIYWPEHTEKMHLMDDAIRKADEEIEEAAGIHNYPPAFVTFAAGTKIRCVHCGSIVEVAKDGYMPYHETTAPRQTGPDPDDVEVEPIACKTSGQFLSLALAKPTTQPYPGRFTEIKNPLVERGFFYPERLIITPESISYATRGTCRGCEGTFVLDNDNLIPEHGSILGHYGDSYKAPCAGSGLPPSDNTTSLPESETQTQQITEDECNPPSPPQPESKS
jgi:hypothetical protein